MPDATQTSPVRRFGTFEIDLHSGELRKRGMRLRLSGQAAQVLTVLIEHAGEIVAREDLHSKLWQADTFVDFDHGLNNAIARIREVLDDSSDTPRYVETIPRRGYRFIAPLADVGPAMALAPSKVVPESKIPPSDASAGEKRIASTRLRVLLAGVVLLTLLIFAFVLYRGSRAKATSQPPIKSVAVLPLKNISSDPNQEYLADGMTEELIGRLSKIHQLRVTSRTSVMQFKDTRMSAPEIAKTLRVDAIVEGSVIREGDRIRVHAQLIRGATDEHVWSEAYDRELRDVLALESEVAQAIAEHVRVQLTPQQEAWLHSAPQVNPAAYEAYLKGRGFETDSTLQGLRTAEGYFRDALQKDPSFALAYVGLADCYLDLGDYRWVRPQDAYRQANEAFSDAMRLDVSLAEVHTSLGYLHWRYDWDWSVAEKELRYGVELNPNNVNARETLAWYLSWSGRRAEALAEIEAIRQSDPAYPFTSLDESGVYYHLRDYKELMEASRKALATNPNIWSGHYFLAVGYDGSGQPTEAIPEYKKAVELSQGNTDALAGLAHAYATAGERSEAAKILRQLQQQAKTSYVSPYMIATIYAALEEKDRAFELLESSYQEKSPDIPYFLKADLRLDSLRADPRFLELGRRVGLDRAR
jgi:TolB-like protein/DNA-binding winged helix-turn-helix (wHTH) protein/Tfp pilus assembly protein PilF